MKKIALFIFLLFVSQAFATLTQSDWSYTKIQNQNVWTCTVAGTDDADLMTKKLHLQPGKPFSLYVIVNEDLSAAGTAALDVWGGYTSTCSLATGDVGTGCALVHANSLDLDAGVNLIINVFPGIEGTVTQVTNASPGTALIPSFPYYIFNVDLSATLQDAATITFIVVQ
jgi:hypothetical protein